MAVSINNGISASIMAHQIMKAMAYNEMARRNENNEIMA
jgi:xanthine/uracil/vitamin C permease (AzgA family)